MLPVQNKLNNLPCLPTAPLIHIHESPTLCEAMSNMRTEIPGDEDSFPKTCGEIHKQLDLSLRRRDRCVVTRILSVYMLLGNRGQNLFCSKKTADSIYLELWKRYTSFLTSHCSRNSPKAPIERPTIARRYIFLKFLWFIRKTRYKGLFVKGLSEALSHHRTNNVLMSINTHASDSFSVLIGYNGVLIKNTP